MRNTTMPTPNSMRALRATTLVAVFLCLSVGSSFAQFSQAVIVLKGTVISETTGKPTGAKVSVRAINDTAQEITSSHSNSETGNYLVVLKPGKKYWVHVEGDTIITKDVQIETPITDRSQQMVKDLSVTVREEDPKPAATAD